MMISRKKILSRSQSDMDYSSNYNAYQCDEDVWYNKEKLYNDHIQEIFKKWEQLDDEIWLKVICMERNRRIAKAYARVPLLTINGGTNGFDGYKIGLMGFDNPLEDHVIKRVKHNIGKGVRIKIDELGNVIIKRLSTADIMIRGYERESCALGKDIVESNGNLPADTSIKLFDIKKFQQNISKELRINPNFPNRQKLEAQCIIVIGFVRDSDNILELPVWCLLINIVALDMLKSRLPSPLYRNNEFSNYSHLPKFISVFDKSDGQRQIVDEDPYSVPSLPQNKLGENNQGSGASNSSSASGSSGNEKLLRNNPPYLQIGPINDLYSTRIMAQHQQQSQQHHQYMAQQRMMQQNLKIQEKENNPAPPALPPRDFSCNKQNNNVPKKTKTRNFAKVFRFGKSSDNKKKVSSDEEKPASDLNTTTTNEIEYEDPYYYGMQARVSNFNNRQRKSLAVQPPVQSYMNSNNGHMRKANSHGYLNAHLNLFSSNNNNLYPNSKASYYSQQYDSSFESDPYAISSTNENTDYYAIYGNRMHPNIYPAHHQPLGYRRSPQENYHHMQPTMFSKDRYATQWD